MTYPMKLKEAGCQVGFIGKYGIGKNTEGVDDKFDYFWGTASQPRYENEDENGNYIHYTDLVDQHIDQFSDSTDIDNPFCLSVSFKAPHVQDGDPRQFIYNPTDNKNVGKVISDYVLNIDIAPTILSYAGIEVPKTMQGNNLLPLIEKGYEFTSCVEGLVELYKTTGNEQYFTAAKNIHAVLVKWERTPVGSVSFNDKYVGSAGIINTVSEICDAVYWNRLSYELFLLTGDEKYIEEIERTLYNSLLCAFNQEGTWRLRHLRMSHIHIPAHNHFLQNHQCCTNNLPRGLFQAGEVVLAKKGNNIFLTLFNEGEGEIMLPAGQTAHFKIEGDFLNNSKAIATLSIQKPERFTLKIRNPKWSNRLKVRFNKNLQTGESDRRWFNVGREWKNNDKIEIVFDMDVWWETFHPAWADSLFDDAEFYKREWAAMKFKNENNKKINSEYEHVKSLQVSDALPNTQAVTFFYGPLALSCDVRVTEGDISSAVQFTPAAGNTWDNSSEFNTWCILKNQN
ncbi:MAG: glycoside hydrolase family 127 protein [Draconibacterium sp.]|nr:glycoside hydrolase family 127 protein [Draconibacterium sp.]